MLELEQSAAILQDRSIVDASMMSVLSPDSCRDILDSMRKTNNTIWNVRHADPYGFAELQDKERAVTGTGSISALKLFKLLNKHGIIKTQPKTEDSNK